MYMESTLWQRCLQNNGRVSMDKKSGKLLIMIINCSPLPHSPGDTIRACTVLQSLYYLLLLLIVTKKLCWLSTTKKLGIYFLLVFFKTHLGVELECERNAEFHDTDIKL